MHQTMRLGRGPVKHDSRTLQLASYLDMDVITLPTAPPSRTWSAKANPNFGMYLNDKIGDCTIAGAAHAVQIWSANESHEINPPEGEILLAYEKACGYNPLDPSTDQGGVEIDVLNYWRKQGIAGHKIDAYAAVEPHNHAQIKAAIDLFGLVYIGVDLPISAQTQTIWSAVNGYSGSPGGWGGHCIICVDYSPNYITCVTWGQLKKMTYGFWDKYVSESYALLSGLWAQNGHNAPSGFNYGQLKKDLSLL